MFKQWNALLLVLCMMVVREYVPCCAGLLYVWEQKGSLGLRNPSDLPETSPVETSDPTDKALPGVAPQKSESRRNKTWHRSFWRTNLGRGDPLRAELERFQISASTNISLFFFRNRINHNSIIIHETSEAKICSVLGVFDDWSVLGRIAGTRWGIWLPLFTSLACWVVVVFVSC